MSWRNLPPWGAANEEQAEAAGRDAGQHGPSTINCHPRYFATPALTAAWEKGNEAGKALKGHPTP